MTIDRWIHVLAGSFILLSLALGVQGSPLFVSPWMGGAQDGVQVIANRALARCLARIGQRVRARR